MTKIIAEVGNAHDGSLGNAHAFIDAVHAAGADAVKYQCRIPERESTEAEQFRPGTYFPQDKTRYQYWQRVSFTRSQWIRLSEHARDQNIEFGASVFCSLAVSWLVGLVDFWKVPAPSFSNPFIRGGLKHTDGPIYWSLGHHPEVTAKDPELLARVVPLYCVSRYPSPPERIDLSVVNERVGLSDHSGTIWPALLAAYRGAPAVEVHVCWHRSQFGPDTLASITVDELGELCRAVKWIRRLGRQPLKLDEMQADHEQFMRGRRVA